MIAGSGADPVIGIPGGQLMLTTDVENYPGFPEGVTGPDMMELFRKQAERFGSEIVYADATAVDVSKRPFRVETAKESYQADALKIRIANLPFARWVSLKRLMNSTGL